MDVELYPYQEEALAKLHNGSILCGGVGSGKSITALSYWVRNEDWKGLYIITTARKRDDKEWEAELEKFDEYAATIDSWNNIGKYVGVNNCFFIFDEQRVIGNGAWVKSFIKITKHNDWIMLSATPGDTWTDYIPVFIANGFYRNRYEFITRHVVYERFSKYPKVNRYLDQAHLNKLRRSILVDMDYHRPAERVRYDITVEYDHLAYKQLFKTRFDQIRGRPFKSASELCYGLRRAINEDPSRQMVVESIAIEKGKVIVFYNFDYEREILLNLNLPSGFEIAEWNGHKHEPIPSCDEWVYLVQYAAGAEGWNCIATDTIIFYSLSYSYKTMEQACGRIDRVNTPFEKLYYYYLSSKAPLDIAIGRALKAKKQFNEKRWVG